MKKKKQDDKKQEIIEQFSKMTKTEKAKMIRQRILNDDLPDDVIEAMLHILPSTILTDDPAS